MSVDVVAFILIPIAIFVLGALAGGIRIAIRMAQYMVRTEESQFKTAASNEALAEKLENFTGQVTATLQEHSDRLLVIEVETGLNGRHVRYEQKVANG